MAAFAFAADMDMPVRIAIGTEKAFDNQYAYNYSFNEDTRTYVCNQTTQNGRPNEVLMIAPVGLPDGTWFVAVEGLVIDGAFEARQMAFRTQAEFWVPGWHTWQTNSACCRRAVETIPPACWDVDWLLNAATRIAED